MRATWPHAVRWSTSRPRMIGEARDRQLSISGAETVTPALAGRWEIEASFSIYGEAQELSWQAFIAQMEGGLGTALIPVQTRFRPTTRDGLALLPYRQAGIAGAQTFEHFGFDSAPVATMTLAQAAPLRATVLAVTPGNTTGLRPGQFFSIGERLHQVQQHWVAADGVERLMIRPGLRAAAAAGAVLVLDQPVCLMRLTDVDGDLEYSGSLLSKVECTFVEAL